MTDESNRPGSDAEIKYLEYLVKKYSVKKGLD
jgi:hypothetical protein